MKIYLIFYMLVSTFPKRGVSFLMCEREKKGRHTLRYYFVMWKYVWLYVLLFFVVGSLSAQKAQRKGSMFRAEVHFQKGKLDLAKKEIDLILKSPKKTKRLGVWLLRGEIYRAILLSDSAVYRSLAQRAGVTAAKSFKQVMLLEKGDKTSPYYVEAYNAFEELWGHHVQQGVDYYKLKDYQQAYNKFALAVAIKPDDSISLSYAGYFAQLNEVYDSTLRHYYRLVDLGKGSLEVYRTLGSLERTYKKNLENALKIIQKAIVSFPEDMPLRRDELLILIKQEKIDDVRRKIQVVLDSAESDVQLLLFVASFYDGQAEPWLKKRDYVQAASYADTATLYYKRALQYEPTNLIANFNLARAYVNISQKYYHKVRNMDNATYAKAGKAIEEQGKAIVVQALPYLEHLYAEDPKDVEVLSALQQVYYLLGRKKEAKVYQEELRKQEGN